MTDRISFLIDPELKKIFRIRAIRDGCTMTEILLEFIKGYCEGEAIVRIQDEDIRDRN